jgi:hypothetical protein
VKVETVCRLRILASGPGWLKLRRLLARSIIFEDVGPEWKQWITPNLNISGFKIADPSDLVTDNNEIVSDAKNREVDDDLQQPKLSWVRRFTFWFDGFFSRK